MYIRMYVKKAAKKTFVRKICPFNVDEIDTWLVSPKSLCAQEMINEPNFVMIYLFRKKFEKFICLSTMFWGGEKGSKNIGSKMAQRSQTYYCL